MSRKMAKTRHSSLEVPDCETVVKENKEKKKQDVLSKARNKLYNLGDALKSSTNSKTQNFNNNSEHGIVKEKKSRTQATLDYFLKPCPNKQTLMEKNQIYTQSSVTNEMQNGRAGTIKRVGSLKKQHSVGAYPLVNDDTENGYDVSSINAIRYDINCRHNQNAYSNANWESNGTGGNTSTLSRLRPATICGDKVNRELRETDALALERPRKKLSFREPEILGYAAISKEDYLDRKRRAITPEMKRSISLISSHNSSYNNGSGGGIRRIPSLDLELEDLDLESQAMTVVRTVGQAFEVCHKWSITEPKNENADEQDTLTQDLVSDRLSDITSDKPKKEQYFEGASDKLSLPDDDSFKDLNSLDNNNKPQHQHGQTNGKNIHQLDVLLPPPSNQSTRKSSPLTSAETYAAPHSDGLLTAGSGSGGSSSIPAAGSALSVHHELQLLREQLDQQSQQTQAAVAQLQLAREQLAAEQSARMEAQARTHQLLVHNRELLDHIAALVAHLQGSDKATNLPQGSPHLTMPQQQQHHQGLVDGTGNMYHDHSDSNSLEPSPVLQALGLSPQGLIENRAVTSCLPPSPLRTTFNPAGGVFNFNYPQQQQHQQQQQLDFTLENQLLQRLQALSGYTPPQYSCNYNQNLAFLPNLYANPMVNNNYTLQTPPQKKFTVSPLPVRHTFQSSPVMDKRVSPVRSNDAYQSQQSLLYQSQQNLQQATSPQRQASQSNLNQNQAANNQNNNLQVRSDLVQHQQQQQQARADKKSESRYIKPLSQMGTLTTTDSTGRIRVIVPVPSNQTEDAADLLSSLRLDSNSAPAITRSTSEKVPNRSELMSQVHRTTWARHTTK